MKDNKDKEKDKDLEEKKEKEEGPSELDLLKIQVQLLEDEKEKLKKDFNAQIVEFADKKSKEAIKIISDKEKEIDQKYKNEFEQKSKYMYEKQLAEFVEIVSRFETVMNSIKNPEVAGYLVGFKMFLSQFESILDSFKVTAFEPKEGEEYDSDIMQVTSTKSVNDEKLDNKITAVFSKGYKLHDRVIKLSSVEVGKKEG